MLPPPTTIPSSTPSDRTSLMSSTIEASVARLMPKASSPISASPESFRRIRLNLGAGVCPFVSVMSWLQLCLSNPFFIRPKASGKGPNKKSVKIQRHDTAKSDLLKTRIRKNFACVRTSPAKVTAAKNALRQHGRNAFFLPGAEKFPAPSESGIKPSEQQPSGQPLQRRSHRYAFQGLHPPRRGQSQRRWRSCS